MFEMSKHLAAHLTCPGPAQPQATGVGKAVWRQGDAGSGAAGRLSRAAHAEGAPRPRYRRPADRCRRAQRWSEAFGRNLKFSGQIWQCPTPSFEERTDDATRWTLAMRRFVFRFTPAKRRSRFLSRRISRHSQKGGGVLPFSTFPVTSLAKPPVPQRAAPQRQRRDILCLWHGAYAARSISCVHTLQVIAAAGRY
jgi:hypothetical protein